MMDDQNRPGHVGAEKLNDMDFWLVPDTTTYCQELLDSLYAAAWKQNAEDMADYLFDDDRAVISGASFRELRLRFGVAQKTLASAIGRSRSYVHRLEREKQICHARRYLRKLARAANPESVMEHWLELLKL